MNDAPVFYPGNLMLVNATDIIAEAVKKLEEGGSLTIDMRELDKCDSAAVCLLIELARTAKKERCELKIRHIGGQLRKLLRLYQISNFFPAEK